MIPYDDLVARLQSWRARQGLPVSVSPTARAEATSAPVTPAEVLSDDHLEVIDDQHDRYGRDYALPPIESDETTPIGGLPDPTGGSR